MTKRRKILILDERDMEKLVFALDLAAAAKKSAGCGQCANYRPRCDAVDCFQCAEDCACASCKKRSRWEWKGVDEE